MNRYPMSEELHQVDSSAQPLHILQPNPEIQPIQKSGRNPAGSHLEGADGFGPPTAAPTATGRSDPVAGRESHPLKIPD
ncbi:hypothetical protein P12x_000236 [Tundrisphaera lichenicola]|uniref:hypothetical protein n=1 Tax=Tundrisphaera lichenicola TaxID=2029860 RepID=UPI003EBAB02C